MSESGQDSTSSEASHEYPLRASAGARLTAERRILGLSLGDIARQLKLSVRQVEALERDDYASFAGPVFIRGFLRNYAKLLNLNPEEIIAAATPVPAAAVAAPVEALEERQAATPERSRRVLMSAVIAALVVIAVVLLASNAARDRHAEVPASDTPALQPPVPVTQAEPPAVSTPAPASPADMPVALPATAAVASPPPSSAPLAPARLAPAPEVTPAVTDATEASAKPHVLVSGNGPAQVHMVFEGESWVEVRDANGTTIFSRLNSPGTERLIRGTPPLSLVVGNASSVKLLYHDKPVDLLPHTRVDVARITLE